MKRRIRLTEGDLRRIVKKSVRRAVRETTQYDTDNQAEGSYFQIMRMRLSALSNSEYPEISSRARQILDDIKQSDMSVRECLETYWDETIELKRQYREEVG